MTSEDPTQLTPPLAADRLADIKQTLRTLFGSRNLPLESGKTGDSSGVPRFHRARSIATAHFGRSRVRSPCFRLHQEARQAAAFDPLDLVGAVDFAGFERDIFPEDSESLSDSFSPSTSRVARISGKTEV
jgi:hypothetical protein